jgi:hypothetical protein
VSELIVVERGQNPTPVRLLHVAAILMLATTISGCAFWDRISGKQAARATQAQQLQQLQLNVMRFADEYAGRVRSAVNEFQAATKSPDDRLTAQEWKLSQATAAYTDASGPVPVTSALDLVVLATLSRMVVEDSWVTERYGRLAEPLRDAHRALEIRAWELISPHLSAAQQQELHGLIDTWRQQNPQVHSVAFVHFLDFAKSIGPQRPAGEEQSTSGGLFGLIGLDPLATLDPAVQEITQTRLLAERAIYYAQRTPALIDMQVERLTFRLAVMPETLQLLGDMQRTSLAAQQAGNLADALPAVLARERAAIIAQFMGQLASQQDKMATLAVQLREALQAGGAMSDSVNTTITSLNALLKEFNAPPPPGTLVSPPGKPFDITDYTAAAKQLTATTQELIGLIQAVNAGTPAIATLETRASGDVKSLVNFIVWRIAALIVLLAVAVLAIMSAYRWMGRRRGVGDR